jgi:glucose/arabinose dehydrogenase
MHQFRTALPVIAAAAVAACSSSEPRAAAVVVECDPDNAGLTLSVGFCALAFADVAGGARHIAVRPDGDVLVATYPTDDAPGGIVVLRDTTGDGRADVSRTWGPVAGGTGIALEGNHVWFATNDAVLRYNLPPGQLEPAMPPDTIVYGLPADRSHRAKSIALSNDRLFVNIGSPSNSCQRQDREAGSPGMDPCPDLETRAGIWVFDANAPNQTQADGSRFATGIRNAVAIGINPADNGLFAVQHGRDQLFANWSEVFDSVQSATRPAEELLAIDPDDDFGWPYCFYDPQLGRKVVAPEYGGDGEALGRCANVEGPIFAFPAHWAPNGLLFYSGSQFPPRYREGVFVAFHGSWNRAPLPQGGYNIAFLPFNAGAPLANFDVFADGFAGADVSPGGSAHRPVGLAQGPDGSIYITDDKAGMIWRVIYRGE